MAEKNTKNEKKAPKKEASKEKVVKKAKSKRRSVPTGNAYINASYNNTIITLTEPNGDTISWATAGSSGFKGTRKSTPFAAQTAAEKAVEKAKVFGLQKVHVFVKGVGSGREQSIRGLVASGLDIISINDMTPIPHNGCRKKKARRV
ncbi:MAG: 30S ribosomal protein S11 [Candidatus Gracilibacteria bacterium]|nr:30S ribosomal protein S11 [Candidatus Gracilibacteria bacterium]